MKNKKNTNNNEINISVVFNENGKSFQEIMEKILLSKLIEMFEEKE